VIALHDHSGFKFFGKEKIADGRNAPPRFMVNWRRENYGGRAFANALAKEGFVVLVHDTFLWGSRRFPREVMPYWTREAFMGFREPWEMEHGIPQEIGEYNFAASQHEHVVEKYCSLLGTTLAGVISHEDRIGVNYLCSRSDVIAEQVGCIGLSGGGCRVALLQATHDRLRAAVIVGMMSTYDGLLDKNVINHTWMLFPTGWARYGDWPDLAACRAPSPLLVQYDLDDDLFTVKGMKAADQRLAAHYRSVGQPKAYRGEFFPGPHKFDLEMQASAFVWLRNWLSE
jgi:dienelactone hydrolase